MYRTVDLDEFVSLLLRSKLAGLSEIQPALTEVLANSQNLDKPETVKLFCDRLVADKILTAWQCEKLLNGRYKGFFMGPYTLQDYSHSDETHSYYRAFDAAGHYSYLLKITPRSVGENGEPVYEVVGRESRE